MNEVKEKTWVLLKVTACIYLPLVFFALLYLVIVFGIKLDINFNGLTSSAYNDILWAPFVYYYYKKHCPRPIIPAKRLSAKYSIIAIAIGGAWYGLALLCSYIITGEIIFATIKCSLFEHIFQFIGVVMVAPIIEELFFRQWIPSYMSKHGFSNMTTIAVSALLFYSIHLDAVTIPYWYSNIDTFFMGVVLSLCYAYTKDIRYCIIAHMLSNIVALFIAIL
ncbi:CPBP family intramembrane glutamic endopeptidase [Prevotella sp. P2-180]|uniref:CPBP family intramembrane glutamic endopeptidase n=1 Tax=Prevotella sp. P2-180 TaxID=2024224 RepID=UPI000B95F17F|nr:CPBP family intramembrane glutamic endopeptidase [Prevotella sp. P2-180]OYP60637.1 hypothetical protein CIK98_16815 [Prevotella sp. P2-180]